MECRVEQGPTRILNTVRPAAGPAGPLSDVRVLQPSSASLLWSPIPPLRNRAGLSACVRNGLSWRAAVALACLEALSAL